MMLASCYITATEPMYVHTFEKKSNCWLSEYVHNNAL